MMYIVSLSYTQHRTKSPLKHKSRTRVFGRPVRKVVVVKVLPHDGGVVALLELALVLAPVKGLDWMIDQWMCNVY